MDTIHIELVVTAAQIDESDIWMQGDLDLRINGEKPYSDGDIINYQIFLQSLTSNGEFFIFSCCCGSPACGGWERGIQVTHNNETISWTDTNRNKSWTLDKKMIEAHLSTVREQAATYRKFFAQKGINYVGVEYQP